jgi:hypothetical protein
LVSIYGGGGVGSEVHFEYQLNKAMLTLTRTLIDDEFQEK